jgi:hypothetical protein
MIPIDVTFKAEQHFCAIKAITGTFFNLSEDSLAGFS